MRNLFNSLTYHVRRSLAAKLMRAFQNSSIAVEAMEERIQKDSRTNPSSEFLSSLDLLTVVDKKSAMAEMAKKQLILLSYKLKKQIQENDDDIYETISKSLEYYAKVEPDIQKIIEGLTYKLLSIFAQEGDENEVLLEPEPGANQETLAMLQRVVKRVNSELAAAKAEKSAKEKPSELEL